MGAAFTTVPKGELLNPVHLVPEEEQLPNDVAFAPAAMSKKELLMTIHPDVSPQESSAAKIAVDGLRGVVYMIVPKGGAPKRIKRPKDHWVLRAVASVPAVTHKTEIMKMIRPTVLWLEPKNRRK